MGHQTQPVDGQLAYLSDTVAVASNDSMGGVYIRRQSVYGAGLDTGAII